MSMAVRMTVYIVFVHIIFLFSDGVDWNCVDQKRQCGIHRIAVMFTVVFMAEFLEMFEFLLWMWFAVWMLSVGRCVQSRERCGKW